MSPAEQTGAFAAEVRVGERLIGPGRPPFIVAEISGNHMGSLERALTLVDAAADAGADAVKIQTYTADSMTIDVREREFLVNDPESPWYGRALYDLYEEAHTPWDWHAAIQRRCAEREVVFFSTPFDPGAVAALDGLGVPLLKIASFENVDAALIRRAAQTGKPLIISLGMATVGEIAAAVETARDGGCDQLVLLACASAYPAAPSDFNLRTLPHLQQLFGVPVGLSDHTLGIGVSVAAVALGACLIEKHLTLARGDGAIDSAFSMVPDELAQLVTESRAAWESLGTVSYAHSARENQSAEHRRSLYVVADVGAGEVLSAENVRAIRPGLGLPSRDLELVLGRRFAGPVRRGTPLAWDLIG